MVTKAQSYGTNDAQRVPHNPFHLSRNTAIAIILLALLIGGIIAYTELGILKPKATPVNNPYIEPVAPQYLPYNETESSIFLSSATISYGPYPGPSVNQMGNTPGIKKGALCFIVNATIRNDYSEENPPPDQKLFNITNADVSAFLTAQIFNTQGQVNATDVTLPYPPVPYPGALVGNLASGNSTTVTIYLATNNQDIKPQDINRFVIILEYVGSLPP